MDIDKARAFAGGASAELPQKVRLGLLFSVYGALLNENRARVMELWLNDDLSLSEIAEQAGITRQGVHDSIKKSEKQLIDAEEKLGVAQRMLETERYIRIAEARFESGDDAASVGEARETFRKITELWEDDKWRSRA